MRSAVGAEMPNLLRTSLFLIVLLAACSGDVSLDHGRPDPALPEAGPPPTDTSAPPSDTSPPLPDAAPPPLDAGPPPDDAAPPTFEDGGPSPTDAAAPPPDDAAAPPPDDAAAPPPDDAAAPPPTDAEPPPPLDDAAPAHDSGPPACVDPDVIPSSGAISPCGCGCVVEAEAYLHALADQAALVYATTGSLCAPALADVPGAWSGTHCYQPSSYESADFHAGDPSAGWVCLGADTLIVKKVHCQYAYRQGSGYIAPSLGGVDPGQGGFEISARGDVDGNGVMSTFAIAGMIDPVTGKLTISPVFQDKPLE